MSDLLTSGIYLQKIEEVDDIQIKIFIMRNVDTLVSAQIDYFKNSTPLTLHIKDEGRALKLDFDPWSDINVTPDSSIDQKDIDAITALALAYYHQSTIGLENAAYLRHLSTGELNQIVIEMWDAGEHPHPLSIFDAFDAIKRKDDPNFYITKFDEETRDRIEVGDDLQSLAHAFIKLKL
jgi:hypothetical protein